MFGSRIGWLVVLGMTAVVAGCSKRDVLNKPGKAQGKNVPTRPVELIVEAPASNEMELGLEEPTAVIARVNWADDGEPAANRTVSFRISGTAAGSTLTPDELTTDDEGRVQTLL